MRKKFTVGDYEQLYISKFVANIDNICNFKYNSVHIFVAFLKGELLFVGGFH